MTPSRSRNSSLPPPLLPACLLQSHQSEWGRVGHGLEGIVDSSQGVHQPNALPCPRQLTAATDRGFEQLTRNIKINGHTIGGNRNRGRFVMMLLELEPCLFFENAF